MPDHRVTYRRDLFRRFQAWQVKQGRQLLRYASGHGQHQICSFEHVDRGQKIRQMDGHTPLQPGFERGREGRKAIVAQCEESLRRLQTDYIDLYYLHNWDRFTPIEETMMALDDLVKSGKVRYVGFSDAPA